MRMIMALMSLCLAAGAMASPEEAAQAFVDYWNAGEARAERNSEVFTEAFIARRGADGLAGIMNMVYGDNGKIAVHSITTGSDEKVVFLASSDEGNWLDVNLDLAGDGRIAGFGVGFTAPPAGDEDKGLDAAAIAQRLEALVDAQFANGEFSGAVLLAKDFRPVFARAWGLADHGHQRPNTLDTPFNLGSMNKMFTGVAIAQLAMQGKLSFGDTVGRHLPDYPDARVRDEVTLHQLLTHTSGLGTYWNERYEQLKNDLRTTSDFVPSFLGDPLAFDPGQGEEYSNVGPVVLGLVIEKITGQDYFDYVREHIYAAAGMTRSDHYDKFESVSGKASGYEVSGNGELEINTEWLGRIGSPAGGGYASANDLLRFARALYDGSLLDEAHRDTITTAKVPWGGGGGYGYLFADLRVAGQRLIGHNGGAPGINADFAHFPELGYTLIVLSNFGGGAMPIAEQAHSWIAHSAD